MWSCSVQQNWIFIFYFLFDLFQLLQAFSLNKNDRYRYSINKNEKAHGPNLVRLGPVVKWPNTGKVGRPKWEAQVRARFCKKTPNT
jgi:hypothetical protein